MKYDPNIHKRRSIRLEGYDYSQPGAYFITVCILNRQPLFGAIVDDEMILNSAGKMIQRWWNKLKHNFRNIELDQSFVMPDHFHGIIQIHDRRGRPANQEVAHAGAPLHEIPFTPTTGVDPQIQGEHMGAPLRNPIPIDRRGRPACLPSLSGSPLHEIVQWFKTMTTNEYIRNAKENGWVPFDGKLWQRNYYEHIIRDDESLREIREYIVGNAVRRGRPANQEGAHAGAPLHEIPFTPTTGVDPQIQGEHMGSPLRNPIPIDRRGRPACLPSLSGSPLRNVTPLQNPECTEE